MSTLLEPESPKLTTLADLSDLTFVPGDVMLGALNIGADDACAKARDLGNHVDMGSDSGHDTSSSGVPNSPDVLRGRRGRGSRETATTMVSDVRSSNSNCQTDQKRVVSRDTSTSGVERKVKASGTMTEQQEAKPLTEAPVQAAGSDQSLDQPMPAPDLLPNSPQMYSGRRIFSRRIQTDISVSGCGNGARLTDAEVVRMLNAGNKSSEQVSAKPVTSQQLELSERDARRARRRAAAAVMAAEIEASQKVRPEVGTMTYYDVRVVPETIDRQTSPKPEPDRRLKQRTREKGTGTDDVEKSDQETATIAVHTESRAMLTDHVNTCDRATDSVSPATQHRAVGTIAVRKDSNYVQVTPRVTTVTTNTPVTVQVDQECQASDFVDLNLSTLSPHGWMSNRSSLYSSCEGDLRYLSNQTLSSITITKDTASDPIKFPNSCKATETTKIRTSTQATETMGVKKVDRDTATAQPQTVSQWTETISPQMVSTGITPPRPATLDTGVSTVPVTTSDEATGTEVKTFRDTQTEMVLLVCDNETLTDLPRSSDAQTGMDFITETASCGTDAVDNTTSESMTSPMGSATPSPQTPRKSHLVDTVDTSTGMSVERSPPPAPGETCSKCGHLNAEVDAQTCDVIKDKPAEKNGGEKSETVSSCDVGTMAMSCNSFRPTLQVRHLSVSRAHM